MAFGEQLALPTFPRPLASGARDVQRSDLLQAMEVYSSPSP